MAGRLPGVCTTSSARSYGTDAGSNDGDYSNAEFDDAAEEGLGESDLEAANEYVPEGPGDPLQGPPAIPLWYTNVTGGYGENVREREFDWHTVPIYYQITKSE